MNINVFTYNDPKQIINEKGVEQFFDGKLHVCATSNMKRSLKENLSRKNDENIISMNDYMSLVYPSLFSMENKLADLLELTDKLNKLFDAKFVKDEILISFIKNKVEVLDTLRLLSINQISGIELEKVSETAPTKLEKYNHINKIVFHGFYFITPEQQVAMERTKINFENIDFLIFKDNKNQKHFKFIDSFINSNFGWPNSTEFQEFNHSELSGLGNSFLSILDGELLDERRYQDTKLCQYTFTNFTDFIKHTQSSKFIEESKSTILSTNADYMNGRLQEFYPENYKGFKNFLKFPLGALLVTIHKLWTSDGIRATSGDIQNILNTHFFYEKGEEYLSESFSKMIPYVADCETVKEWNIRLEELKKLKEEIQNHDVEDFYEIFNFLSYLSLSIEEIDRLKEIINQIFEFTTYLIGEDDSRVDLNKHLSKIVDIIENEITKGTEKHNEILSELKERLDKKIKILDVSKLNLLDAISFYLSGNMESEKVIVQPFVNIDGEIFRNRKIHVTGLDEKGLPYGNYKYPWPLDDVIIDDLGNINKNFKLLEYRNQHVVATTRYLLFMLFQFSNNTELSYIQNYENNKNLSRTFYLDLMEKFVNQKEFDRELNQQSLDFDYEGPMNLDISSYSDDIRAAFKLNPTRGVLQLIEPNVTYSTSLQQEMLISGITTILNKKHNLNVTGIKEILRRCFPQFDDFVLFTTIDNQIEFIKERNKAYIKNFEKDRNELRLLQFLGRKWSVSEERKTSIKDLYSPAKNNLTLLDFKNQFEEKQWTSPYSKLIQFPPEKEEIDTIEETKEKKNKKEKPLIGVISKKSAITESEKDFLL